MNSIIKPSFIGRFFDAPKRKKKKFKKMQESCSFGGNFLLVLEYR